MIVVAIVGVLAAVAMPAYTGYVARATRADARTQLMQAALFMQRFYSANDSYAEDRAGNAILTAMPAAIKNSPADGTTLYTLSIPTATSTDFVLRMVPVAAGKMANDKCGTFTLTATGVKGVLVNNAVGSTALRDECWK